MKTGRLSGARTGTQPIHGASGGDNEDRAMKLAVYVNYRGNCEEAFRFYQDQLGATSDGVVRRHGEMPNPNVPTDWSDKVVHARLEIGSTVLMGADIPHAEPMRSSYLTLLLDEEAEAERIYAALIEGGEVFMELQQTPFANRFAMLRDRFGASWMLLHQP
jgi:PhnB protein